MHSIYVKMCKICITFNLIFETHCDISPGACNKYFTVIYSKYLKKRNFFRSEYIMKKIMKASACVYGIKLSSAWQETELFGYIFCIGVLKCF